MKFVFLFVLSCLASLKVGPAEIADGITAYNKGDYKTALAEFSPAAKRGDPEGMHLLASLYYQGHGVEKDLDRAVELFLLAAKKGYRASQANLGLMYEKGDGVVKNVDRAVEYYTAAGKQGDLQSAFRLGSLFSDRDIKRAVAYFKYAAERGHIGAANEYGLLFAQGLGVEKDPVEAYGWISWAAGEYRSHASAKKNLDQLKEILGKRRKEGDARAAEIRAGIAKRGVVSTVLSFEIGKPGGQEIFIGEKIAPPLYRRTHRHLVKKGDEFGEYRRYRVEKYLEITKRRKLAVLVIKDLTTGRKAEIVYRGSAEFPPTAE